MSAVAVDPVFTWMQAYAFAGLLTFAVALQTVFSPKRRAIMGRVKFALASAVVAAPGLVGVTFVRSACRLGYLEDGRGFWEANLRSLVWMSGAIFAGQIATRYLPPMAWLTRDLRDAGRAVWSERLGRWLGRPR